MLCALPAHAEEKAEDGGGIWVSASAGAAMYTISGMAFGGGLSLGYGKGAAIGLKTIWLTDTSGVTTLELNFLFRWYFLGGGSSSGPFVQLGAGPVIFADNKGIAFPSDLGTLSAGLNLGWRFFLWRNFFLEPALRAGYPYIAGLDLAAGFQF